MAEEDSCMSTDGTTVYGDYLQLDKLLTCQDPFSSKFGNTVDDEHLFIITHQVYELWFKQILFDLDAVCKLFTSPFFEESSTLIIVSKLERISRIMQVLDARSRSGEPSRVDSTTKDSEYTTEVR